MYSRPKPSSPSYAEAVRGASGGYTLLELLMAMTMMLIVGAIAFSTSFQARRQYDSDVARVDLNQNLRSAMDLITMEARQAGGRLGSDFPAVELVDNVAGDRLTVRRHLVEAVLVSCTDRAVGDTRIYVGTLAGVGACSILPDSDADGYPDNVQEYREHRLQYGTGTGPVVLSNGYVYDPTTRQGEYFAFQNEIKDGSNEWYLQLSGGGLTTAYSAVNQPRVYILDESRYDLTSGTLELRRNGDAATPLAVVDGIADFQVTLFMQDTTSRTTFLNTDNWTGIETLQLQLSAERVVNGRTMARTMTSDVFPRNLLSH